MFIDSHAHLDYPDFEGSIDLAIEKAKEAGVGKIINIGTNVEGSKKSLLLSKKYPGIVYATVGVHPHDLAKTGGMEKQLADLRELAKDPLAVAIGEIGLDFYAYGETLSEDDRKEQIKLFESQLEIAQEFDLPIVVHSRDAEDETIQALKKALKQEKFKAVVHCFTGTKEFAKEVLGMGFYIGFTGIITFKNSAAIQEVVREVPLDRMLIETDCPFIAPVPFRGNRNEPAYLVEIVKKIAEIKGIGIKEVEEITTKNTLKLFSIKG